MPNQPVRLYHGDTLLLMQTQHAEYARIFKFDDKLILLRESIKKKQTNKQKTTTKKQPDMVFQSTGVESILAGHDRKYR